MIVPLIMAIWFGITARQAGRSWLAWSIGGAAFAFIISTIVVNLGAAMFGPFTVDGYIPFRIVSAIIAIAVTVLVGRQLMAGLKKKAERFQTPGTLPTDSRSTDEPK